MKKLKYDIGEQKSAETSMDFSAQRDVQAQIRTLKGALLWEGDLEDMRTSKWGVEISIDPHNKPPTTNNLH